MKANMFAKAKIIEAKAPASKKPKKEEVQIEGLKEYAALDAMEKAIKAMKEAARSKVEGQVRETFVEKAAETGRRPENFRGVEDNASASCELRKRSSASGLREEEVQMLTAAGVRVEEVADRPEGYMFNPAKMTDEVMGIISKRLEGVKGLPEDLIVFQEATKKWVVIDESIEDVVRKDRDTIEKLLPIVTVLGLKPTIEQADAMIEDVLQTLLGEREEGAA